MSPYNKCFNQLFLPAGKTEPAKFKPCSAFLGPCVFDESLSNRLGSEIMLHSLRWLLQLTRVHSCRTGPVRLVADAPRLHLVANPTAANTQSSLLCFGAILIISLTLSLSLLQMFLKAFSYTVVLMFDARIHSGRWHVQSLVPSRLSVSECNAGFSTQMSMPSVQNTICSFCLDQSILQADKSMNASPNVGKDGTLTLTQLPLRC